MRKTNDWDDQIEHEKNTLTAVNHLLSIGEKINRWDIIKRWNKKKKSGNQAVEKIY